MMAVLGALFIGIWIGAKIEEKFGHPKGEDDDSKTEEVRD